MVTIHPLPPILLCAWSLLSTKVIRTLLYNTLTLLLHSSLQVIWVKTPTSQRSSGLHQKCVQPAIRWRKTGSTSGARSRFSSSSCPTSHPAVSSQVQVNTIVSFLEEIISHEFKDFYQTIEMYFFLLPACVSSLELNNHDILLCLSVLLSVCEVSC